MLSRLLLLLLVVFVEDVTEMDLVLLSKSAPFPSSEASLTLVADSIITAGWTRMLVEVQFLQRFSNLKYTLL